MKHIHSSHRETDGLPTRMMSPSHLSLEERIKRIEEMMGIYTTPESIDSFLNSAEGRAEYRAALVQMSVYHNKKPFEKFLEKTGGSVPR